MQGQGAIYMLPLRHTARLHCSQHGTKPQSYHAEGSLGGPPDSRRRRASTVSGVVWAKAPSRTSANDQLHSGEETIRLQYSCQALLKQFQIEKNENWEFAPKCSFSPFPFPWLLLGWLRHSLRHPLQIPRTLHAFLGLTKNCIGSITTYWFRCHPGLTCFKMGSRFKTHQPYVYITHIQYIYIYSGIFRPIQLDLPNLGIFRMSESDNDILWANHGTPRNRPTLQATDRASLTGKSTKVCCPPLCKSPVNVTCLIRSWWHNYTYCILL